MFWFEHNTISHINIIKSELFILNSKWTKIGPTTKLNNVSKKNDNRKNRSFYLSYSTLNRQRTRKTAAATYTKISHTNRMFGFALCMQRYFVSIINVCLFVFSIYKATPNIIALKTYKSHTQVSFSSNLSHKIFDFDFDRNKSYDLVEFDANRHLFVGYAHVSCIFLSAQPVCGSINSPHTLFDFLNIQLYIIY